MYINGNLVSSKYALKSLLSSLNTFFVGREDPNAKEQWNGTLDEVKIYDRTLSDNEIKELCFEGNPTGTICVS